MNAYVRPTGRRVQPFDDPPGECLVLNRRLADWQADMLREAGLTAIDAPRPPCLVVPDTLFTTGAALRGFVDGAAGRNAVLVLKRSVFGRETTPVQPGVVPVEAGWRFEEVRFVSGGDEPAIDVVVDPDEKVHEIPLPTHYTGRGKIEIPFPRHPLMTIHHWVHVLWANQVAGSIELRATSPLRLLGRVLWAFLRTWSFNKWRLLSRMNRMGRGCDIHPTATVEGCVLGEGVTVGPYARVLFSRLADGATVMAGAQVEASVVGERAVVAQVTVLRFSVLYPEAIAGQQLMQQCVLGRRAVTTLGAFTIDLNFDNPVRVPLDGALHSTGAQFIGAAFGHRSRVGTGHWMAPGRMVPNDCFLVREPERVIRDIAADLGGQGPVVNRDGVVRPVGTPRGGGPS